MTMPSWECYPVLLLYVVMSLNNPALRDLGTRPLGSMLPRVRHSQTNGAKMMPLPADRCAHLPLDDWPDIHYDYFWKGVLRLRWLKLVES